MAAVAAATTDIEEQSTSSDRNEKRMVDSQEQVSIVPLPRVIAPAWFEIIYYEKIRCMCVPLCY